MALGHLRANAVAYVSLLLALSLTSASYAGVHLAKGSVTASKIAKSAVTSPKIKPASVKVRDLAAGVTPPAEQTWVRQYDAQTPVAAPDSGFVDGSDVKIPRRGKVVVQHLASAFSSTCTTGSARLGLYVDQQPIPRTAVFARGNPSHAETTMTSGAAILGPGTHTFHAGVNCAGGDLGLFGDAGATWTVSLLAQ